MRVLLATLLLLATCLVGRAQILWERNWGGPTDDACEVHNTRDGGSIALVSYGVDTWMLRLDALGDTLWSRRISRPLDLCAVTETADGGFLLTGTDRVPHRDIVAWKFDLRGDSLWMRTYVDSNTTEGMYAVIEGPDSSFHIGGYTSGNGYDMLVLHIDSLGNLLWRRQYGTPDFEGGTVVARLPDGSLALATTSDYLGGPHIMAARIDRNGDTLWTRHYRDIAPTGGAIVTTTSVGHILINGWIQTNNYDNYLLRLDSLGQQHWARRWGGIGFESRTARGAIEDRFGGYTTVASVDISYAPGGNDFDMALHRLDTSGQLLVTYRVGRSGNDMPRYFEQAANGDYLLLGYTTSFVPGSQQSYLARLGPQGCSGFFYDLAQPLRDTLCPGDTLALDAGAGYVSYLWSNGDTQQVILVTAPDTISVMATDSAGCIHYSNAVVVMGLQPPSFTHTISSDTVFFQAALGSGQGSAWDFGDGNGDTGTNPFHVYDSSGSYLVCLETNLPGCGAYAYCDTVTIQIPVGIDRGGGGPLPTSFPNPARSVAVLKNPTSSPINFTLCDLRGQPLELGELEPNSLRTLQLDHIPAGCYLLSFQWEGKRVTQFLVRQ